MTTALEEDFPAGATPAEAKELPARPGAGYDPPRASRWVKTVAALLAVAAVVLAACGDHVAFISRVPTGYKLDPSASGTLDLNQAAQSTLADSAKLSSLLSADGFGGGKVKIWRDGAQFIGVMVFRMGSSSDARKLVKFELEQAAQRPGGTKAVGSSIWFKIPKVAAATGFLASGEDRLHGSPIFIEGAWFAVGSSAYLVETGGQQPAGTGMLDQMTLAEEKLATGKR